MFSNPKFKRLRRKHTANRQSKCPSIIWIFKKTLCFASGWALLASLQHNTEGKHWTGFDSPARSTSWASRGIATLWTRVLSISNRCRWFDLWSVMCFSCKCLNMKCPLTSLMYGVMVHTGTDFIVLVYIYPSEPNRRSRQNTQWHKWAQVNASTCRLCPNRLLLTVGLHWVLSFSNINTSEFNVGACECKQRSTPCSLVSQGHYGGVVLTPNAQHSERCAPVSLTVRANCRGQTVVGKLGACCALMFC